MSADSKNGTEEQPEKNEQPARKNAGPGLTIFVIVFLTAALGAGAFFMKPYLNQFILFFPDDFFKLVYGVVSVFVSLIAAVIVFGVLHGTGMVKTKQYKFGGAAAGFLVTLLILLRFSAPPPGPVLIRGTVRFVSQDAHRIKPVAGAIITVAGFPSVKAESLKDGTFTMELPNYNGLNVIELQVALSGEDDALYLKEVRRAEFQSVLIEIPEPSILTGKWVFYPVAGERRSEVWDMEQRGETVAIKVVGSEKSGEHSAGEASGWFSKGRFKFSYPMKRMGENDFSTLEGSGELNEDGNRITGEWFHGHASNRFVLERR